MNNSNFSSTSDRSSIVEILQAASSDLLFVSESEFPFEVFFWELPQGTEINLETIAKQTEIPTDAPIEFVDLESFFTPATMHQDWHGDFEIEIVEKYRHLVQVIQENLVDVRVVRIGKINIDVYIIGKTTGGNFAGLKTKVVET